MTEKRYTIFGEWHKNYVIDEIKDNTGEYVTIGKVVDLINENEQLKKENKKLQDKYDLWIYSNSSYENDSLKEENEQLKTQLSTLTKTNQKNVKKIQKLTKQKENLKDKVYEEIDNTLTIIMELYEDTPVKSRNKMNNLYKQLKKLKEKMI